jgi:hypothetical protein
MVLPCFYLVLDAVWRLVHAVPAVFVLIKQRYIKKIVVIVNASLAVDKKEFIYNVNGLRDHEAAGQALYRCRTDVGQKPGEQKKRLFCTSAPVDMQHLVHSRAGFACL